MIWWLLGIITFGQIWSCVVEWCNSWFFMRLLMSSLSSDILLFPLSIGFCGMRISCFFIQLIQWVFCFLLIFLSYLQIILIIYYRVMRLFDGSLLHSDTIFFSLKICYSLIHCFSSYLLFIDKFLDLIRGLMQRVVFVPQFVGSPLNPDTMLFLSNILVCAMRNLLVFVICWEFSGSNWSDITKWFKG